MSANDHDDLLRRWRTLAVPVQDAERGAARRDRVVGAIGRAIRGSVTRRERGLRLQRVAMGAALAAAVALGVLGAYHADPPREASVRANGSSLLRLSRASGKIDVQRGGRSVVATAGTQLGRGDGLRTALLARAELETEKSQIVLHQAGELSLVAMGPSEERLLLGLGRIDVSVDKEVDPSRRVVIETPHVEVVVRGTLFDVEVARDRQSAETVTTVGVTRGTVSILKDGSVVALLETGDRWSSRAPAPLPAAAAEPVDPIKVSSPPQAAAAHAEPAPQSEPAGTLADENRLFQEALEARNRGEHARAVELFARMLARYPRSPLLEEARVERFRGLHRLGQSARAAAEARRYLAQHPGGFAVEEARRLALEPE